MYLNNGYNFGPYRAFIDNGFDFQQTNEGYICAGSILPSTFVTILPNGTLRQSMVGDWAFGVSQANTYSFSNDYAGIKGSSILIYGSGQDCWILLGETVGPGTLLKPDSLGRAIGLAIEDTQTSAYAYQGGNAGELARVKVFRHVVGHRSCVGGEFSTEYSSEFGNC